MTLLTTLIVIPIIGACLLVFLPKSQVRLLWKVAIGVSLCELIAAAWLALNFEPLNGGFQFLTQHIWSEKLSIGFNLGVDGLSLGLVLLTTLLTPLCLWFSEKDITHRVKAYLIAFLVLEAGLVGVFCSLDLFVFYLFWEVVLVPMYFIIGIWGHDRRIYATTKFVLYTLTGSLLMLVGILGIVCAYLNEFGVLTFNLTELYGMGLSGTQQMWIFLCLFFGFAIKVPLFPFHTWLPDAHVEAPAAGSVMLAGLLLKMGVYGFLRISLPLLPQAALACTPWIITLALIGILYGAFVALAQDDIKKLVAYSSVAHLGFCIVGIFSLTPEGICGGTLQMINHGISTGALFLLIGMLYQRAHSHKISG